jgi:hypothetical protein
VCGNDIVHVHMVVDIGFCDVLAAASARAFNPSFTRLRARLEVCDRPSATLEVMRGVLSDDEG